MEQGRYYGALIQGWSLDKDELEGKALDLRAQLIDELESFLRYRYVEWWFPIDDGEGYQEVPYDKKLEGKWELRIEDDDGRAIQTWRGDL